MTLLQGLCAKHFDTSSHLEDILEYIRSKFQPICHISHPSSSATHFAAAATYLTAAAVCISNFNYTDLQAYINYIHYTFQAFIKLQVSTSTMPANGKGGHRK